MRAAAGPLQLKIGGRTKKKFLVRPPSVSKKPRRVCRPQAARNKISFSRDMCVRENTARAASVEFVRHRRANYARSRPQAFCRKNPEGFSTVLEGVPRKNFRYALRRSGKTPLFFYVRVFFSRDRQLPQMFLPKTVRRSSLLPQKTQRSSCFCRMMVPPST